MARLNETAKTHLVYIQFVKVDHGEPLFAISLDERSHQYSERSFEQFICFPRQSAVLTTIRKNLHLPRPAWWIDKLFDDIANEDTTIGLVTSWDTSDNWQRTFSKEIKQFKTAQGAN